MVGKVLLEPVKIKNMYEQIEYPYYIEARIGVICEATAKSILDHFKVIQRLQNSFWGNVG